MQWLLDYIGNPEWGIDVLNSNFEDELKLKATESLSNISERINYIEKKQEELYSLSLKNINEGITAIRNHT